MGIESGVMPVEAPLVDIAVHVEQPERIGLFLTDLSWLRHSFLADDGVLCQSSWIIAEGPE